LIQGFELRASCHSGDFVCVCERDKERERERDRGLNSDFFLAKQAIYHLSPISSPFCSGYFGDGVSGLVSNYDPPNLSLPSS
jgi:hypothetical protein